MDTSLSVAAETMKPILSILVLTVPARVGSYYPVLVQELERQCAGRPVEILGLYDNKFRSVGAKRNALLQMAQGDWCVFVDDDDWVSPEYVARLAEAIGQSSHEIQVIVFDQTVSVDMKKEKLGRFGVEYYVRFDGPEIWTGKPTHTQCWRTSHARQFLFPDKVFGEDIVWSSQAACGLTVAQQHRIQGPPLYKYQFLSHVTETRARQSRLLPLQSESSWSRETCLP